MPLVEPLGVLEDLRGLVDVFVRDQMIEERPLPVFAGVEDLPGQFLDHPFDYVKLHRLGHGGQDSPSRAMPSPWGATGL